MVTGPPPRDPSRPALQHSRSALVADQQPHHLAAAPPRWTRLMTLPALMGIVNEGKAAGYYMAIATLSPRG